MRVFDIIYNKREGKEHSSPALKYMIEKYTAGEIPDYQMSAWAMAVYFQGMTAAETSTLTMAMADSGDQMDLSSISGSVIDKHSTGGVGDTTSLVLAPLVASAGVPVAKMSGKGLGHTGGTIDKLLSIPGFKTEFSESEFMELVQNTGIVIAGQTSDLAPADKKLYALRDVTATVESIPLIASSIMSKKIAGGASGLVLDVKTGTGAFMKKESRARELAQTMVKIGEKVSQTTTAFITDMSQPLGKAVGNSLEVIEAVQTLKNEGPSDLKRLCLNLGAAMLKLASKVNNIEEGKDLLKNKIRSGAALQKFKTMVENQEGDPAFISDYSLLPAADYKIEISSEKSGFINELDAKKIGLTVMQIGGGREQKGDTIDPAAGVVLNKKYGDKVKAGDLLAELYLNQKEKQNFAVEQIKKSFKIGANPPETKKLIKKIIN